VGFSPSPSWAGAPADEGAALASETVQELHALYRTQKPDGSLEFRGPHLPLESFPILATLTLDLHRGHPDLAFVSHSAAAAARYYGYLFTTRDRNANLLVETNLRYDDGAMLTGIEDPVFNSLLSLDMISLARLNLEIRKPLQALYWYEGARILQERIVDRCFDIDANYFFPFDTNSGMSLHDYYALSVTPLLFNGNVGDNHAAGIINHYILREADVGPEPPWVYAGIGGPPAAAATASGETERSIKTLYLAGALRARGFEQKAVDAVRLAHRAGVDSATAATNRRPAASARYFSWLLDESRFGRMYDPFGAVDVFEAIARSKRRLPDNEIVRLQTSVQTIKAFYASLNTPTESAAATPALKTVETSIRHVYVAVSKTREHVTNNEMYDREDSYSTSGLDLKTSTIRLLDDVVHTLRHIENDLYRELNRGSGLSISAVLLNERAVVDQHVDVKWVISTRGPEPLEIRTAEVIRGQEVDSLIGAGNDPIVVLPGQPHTLISKFPARPDKIDALLQWDFTLRIKDSTGRVIRHNALRTVYLEQPVSVIARFPDGQILQGLTLPVELLFVKKVPTLYEFGGGWHSPSGLQLKEGGRFQFAMSAHQDSAYLRVNVLVPNPCRPGSFPFKVKFFGNGRDLGTISSSFFKPYQWLFVGPFQAAEHALSTQYPPEKSVDLRRGYTGIGSRITWQVLRESANANYGEVLMWGSLSPAGVGYLYTVIESSMEKLQCPVYLASNAPAVLFVNGDRVLEYQPGPDRVAAQKSIRVLRGMNNILIKVVGDQNSRVFFKLGDDTNLASDEFNNNLWELVGDFGEFQERSRRIQAGETEDVQKLVTLRFDDPGANSVSVIGTFNGWSPEHSRMRRDTGGTWEITLSLRPGKYAYRFLVNNRQQVLAPNCPHEESDGYGGKNSVIFVKK
jgi:hypothetical protein